MRTSCSRTSGPPGGGRGGPRGALEQGGAMTVREACAILGVRVGASFEEIQAAYCERAKRCHPDLHGEGVENLERFRRVQEAYETLSRHNGLERGERASGRTDDAAGE